MLGDLFPLAILEGECMIEVSYEYYKNEYKSTLDEDSFKKFVRRAYTQVDNFCFGRFEKASEADFSEFQLNNIKDCICAITDKLADSTNESGVVSKKSKKSETVGPWSVTYSDSSSDKTFLTSLKSICLQYLGNTGLMFSWI